MGRKVKRTAVGLEEVGDYDEGSAPKKKRTKKRPKKDSRLDVPKNGPRLRLVKS